MRSRQGHDQNKTDVRHLVIAWWRPIVYTVFQYNRLRPIVTASLWYSYSKKTRDNFIHHYYSRTRQLVNCHLIVDNPTTTDSQQTVYQARTYININRNIQIANNWICLDIHYMITKQFIYNYLNVTGSLTLSKH